MMEKIKVWVNKSNLDFDLIKEEFEVVENINQAEYYICWTWIPAELFKDKTLSKVIYFAYEVPLTEHVYSCYSQFKKYLAAFVYHPDSNELNQFPISNNPLYFPVNPFFENDITREVKEINNRIFYCGARCMGIYNSVPDTFGINAKEDRDNLCKFLLKNNIGEIIGEGWPKVTKSIKQAESWRKTKIRDTLSSNCSYHLCFENYLMKGLVSERIHDGFSSDMVILYLGNPEIKNWLPDNCFIDLTPFYSNHTFDYEGFKKKIESMNYEEYLSILNNAREFRKSMDRQGFQKERKRITRQAIDLIKNDKSIICSK